MFSGSKTNLIYGKDATMSNLRLLLESKRSSLLGDPYFGSRLNEIFFENNSPILRDLLIDELYTCIRTFIPQLSLKRSDINVHQDGTRIYATINCINILDNTNNLFIIDLITN